MQTPEYVGSSAARWIFALILFGAALGAGIWGLGRVGGDQAMLNKNSRIAEKPATRAVDPAFFYDRIGNAPALERDEPAQETLSRDGYTLELKVTASREEAERIIEQFQERGIDAYYTPLSRNGRIIYRIRRGIFSDREAAKRAAMTLKSEHEIATRVVKLQ